MSQPILCYGHLLESGWGIDAAQQTLTHSTAKAHVPLELQNKSMTVHGTIRMLRLQDVSDDCLRVRAIQAEVEESLINGAVGWELDKRGCGVGRHISDKFQDPSMVKPDMPGRFFRTTIVQGRDGKWYVLELNEQLDGLVTSLMQSFMRCMGTETS